MQSDTDHEADDDEESSDEETDTDSIDRDLQNSDSDDPKIAKPETDRAQDGDPMGTIFTFRPLPPRPISTSAAHKPTNISIKLPSNAPPPIDPTFINKQIDPHFGNMCWVRILTEEISM